jgi:uncharacterized protein
MPILIDGHNLIGQMTDLSLSDPHDEDKLIHKLRAVAERTGKRMTVVFDPNPHDDTPRVGHGRSQTGNLTIMYTPHGNKADDIIRHMVGGVKDRQGLLVVTSDAAVAAFTRQCGVRVQSSRDFIRWMDAQMAGKHSPDSKPVGSSQEITNWADVFKEPPPDPNQKKSKAAKRKEKRVKADQLADQIKKIRPLF